MQRLGHSDDPQAGGRKALVLRDADNSEKQCGNADLPAQADISARENHLEKMVMQFHEARHTAHGFRQYTQRDQG